MRVAGPACGLCITNVRRSVWGVGADIGPAALDYSLLGPGGEVPVRTILSPPAPADMRGQSRGSVRTGEHLSTAVRSRWIGGCFAWLYGHDTGGGRRCAYGEVIALLLMEEGLAVLTAGYGLQALTIARERCPCLVLTDILMPRMGGMELCRRLRNDPTTGAMVVLMSASVRIDLSGFGAAGIIRKPFAFDNLADTVHRHLSFLDSSPGHHLP